MAKGEDRTIPIHIDKKQYKVPAGAMTGTQLRTLPEPDLSVEYDLFEVVPGGDDLLITDDQSVDLKPGMHFFSAPRNITPGR